ncbi:MAG: hypothetical protein NUV77_11505 [Thermoguttaceae bacterium]|jgi:hypothetical protein|nr:hypothetical protein [Thermoguttaceae bacterium]
MHLRLGAKFLISLAGAFCLALGPAAAHGDKPDQPSPSAPPGTVYYCYGLGGGGIWGMNADGSGKFQALPAGCYGMPSSRVYGPDRHRWWFGGRTVATYENGATQVELCAFRPDGAGGLIEIQLTNVGRQSADDPEFINLGFTAIQGQGFSNDGLDTFVSIEGEWMHWDGTQDVLDSKHILRVRLTGAEIEAAQQTGSPKLTLADPRVRILWPTPDLSWYNHQTHHWGPDVRDMPDGSLVGTLASQFAWEGGDRLVLMDLATGRTWKPCDGGAMDFRLSPVGQKIAIGGGTIATLNYDGSDFRTIATSLFSLGNPCWSPDATQMVYREHSWSGPNKYYIYRIPATGGRKVLLTKDLDPRYVTYPIAWVGNDAPP